MNKLIFLCLASAILLFSIVIVNLSPIINKIGDEWMNNSCKYYSDIHKYDKDKDANSFGGQDAKDEQLKADKKLKNRCNRRHAMVGLEYTTVNINIIFGGICALLGLLHFLNLGSLGRTIGFIGLGCGGIGFVLTLVYVIESGLIFNDITDENDLRIDSDGAFLEWKDGRYKCIFYKKDNKDSIYLRYSDYGNKYLNYAKDVTFAENEKNFKYGLEYGCYFSPIDYQQCKDLEEKQDKEVPSIYINKQKYYDPNDLSKSLGECEKIFYLKYYSRIINSAPSNKKKNIYNSWLTSLILSCFVVLFNIGLAIFGFLLFQDSNGLSGTVSIK